MNTIDITSIILAVITLLGGCGWVIDRKKHRQEIESLKADNRQKEMNLSKDYVQEWRTFIAEPLQHEVSQLRDEVKQLRNAIQRTDRCPHRDSCPVYDELQHHKKGE